MASDQRVVLVVESPFSARDEQRFGVEDLRASGLNVEVWDVCDLTLPHARQQWVEQPKSTPVFRMGAWSEVDEQARTLTGKDAVILICGTHGKLQLKYAPLLEAVLSSPALIGALAPAVLPKPKWHVRVWSAAYRTYVWARSLTEPHVHVPRALDYVWAATTARSVAGLLKSPTTILRYIHALDYDLLLELSERAVVLEEPFVLFVDTMGPLHPDYATLGLANPWFGIDYKSIVQAAFEVLHSSGCRVIVAAHPRAEPGSLDSLYPSSEIRYHQTPTLIRDCEFVLTLEGSTSLGMAAVLARGVVFIGSEALPHSVRVLADNFRRALDAPLLSDLPASDLRVEAQQPVPRAHEYVQRYVKREGTPDQRFWSVVAADIRNRS